MKILSGVATLMALTCSLIPADTYPAPTIADLVTARVARLTRLLTLTTAQATQATSLFTTEETALAAIATSLGTAQTALTAAVEANSATGITAAATSIGTLTASQFQAEGAAQAAFYAMLNTAQQTIYKELLASGLDAPGFGDHGGGGPHHP